MALTTEQDELVGVLKQTGEDIVSAAQEKAAEETQKALAESKALSDQQIEELRTSNQEMATRLATIEEQNKAFSLPGVEAETREGSGFSIARLAFSCAQRDKKIAPLEWEACDQIRKGLPDSVIKSVQGVTKDLNFGIATDWAPFVPQQQMTPFIDALRDNTAAIELGATVFDGLVNSPATFPALATSPAGEWLAQEGTSIPGDPTAGQVALNIRTLRNLVYLSNELIIASLPAADQVITTYMQRQFPVDLDAAIMNGGGAPEPTGILGQAIGEVSHAAAGVVTWQELVGYSTTLMAANAHFGRLGFAMNSAYYAALENMEGTDSNALAGTPNTILTVAHKVFSDAQATSVRGHPFRVTENVVPVASPAPGDCIFGNWSDCYVGFWRTMQIMASNTAGQAWEQNQTGIRGIMYADTNLAHVASFVGAEGFTV